MLILGIFFKSSIGNWWIVVGGGKLYLWVMVVGCTCGWWWRAVLVYGGDRKSVV